MCGRLQVAPSGESYGATAGLAESNGSLLPGLWGDSLHVTCGLTACIYLLFIYLLNEEIKVA